MTDKELQEIWDAAMNYFRKCIFVECRECHPCGWDRIDFEGFKIWASMNKKEGWEALRFAEIHLSDISNGIYDDHPFEGKTVEQILTGLKVDEDWSVEPHRLDVY